MNTKKLFSKWSLGLLLFGFGLFSNANNLQITETSVSGSNITFNVSWENSWNADLAPANWDAVWIFVKYQDCATRQWYHASIGTSGNTAASPLQVDLVSDAKGVFLRRSALGAGNISNTTITLNLNIPAGTYNYKVFGVEMVNIPQGNFQVGDGTSTSTYSSIAITSSSQSGGLTAATLGGASVNIPSTFPMGYNSFYSMKYEITQEQYVEFLNTLTYDQQKVRSGIDPIAAPGTNVYTAGSQYRNGIKLITSGNNNTLPGVFGCDATNGVENNVDDGQNIAMNWMSWADLAAYLDWAALRPMTELEFEKICRGPLARVAGEYPWGTTDITTYYTNSISNGFTAAETIASINNGRVFCFSLGANVNYGPARVGIFATDSTGRSSSGAAYYGAMEMAGNVFERTITTGNAAGASFTGALGDGNLTSLGNADVATWPDSSTALGVGFRGNGYDATSTNPCRTSDRSSATSAAPARHQTYGGRGVR